MIPLDLLVSCIGLQGLLTGNYDFLTHMGWSEGRKVTLSEDEPEVSLLLIVLCRVFGTWSPPGE